MLVRSCLQCLLLRLVLDVKVLLKVFRSLRFLPVLVDNVAAERRAAALTDMCT